jgi:hypothetical protein
MIGAVEREQRNRAMVWWGAMMPHLKQPPGFAEFTGIARPEPARDWQADLARWEAYATMRH